MSRVSATLHPVAASAVTLAAALAAVSVGTDVPMLLVHQAGARAAWATAAVDVALAGFVALMASPFLAAVVWALRHARRASAPLDYIWPFAVAALAAALAMFLTDGFYRPHTAPYVIVALGFGAVLAGMVTALTLAPPRLTNMVLLLGGGGALAVELVAPRALDRELQDLLALLVAFVVLAILQPLRRRLLAVPPAALGLALAALLASSAILVQRIDGLAPGWRAVAWHEAHWQPRFGRALHALVDFDGDGYSPIAWGGDCDDFDATRNPAAHDHNGIDANCNGTVKPLHPSDGDRGLLPPAGDPEAPPDSVELVVLVTIDCLRYDSLSAEVTPRFLELARSGMSFDRLYAAGSDTLKTLPLLLRGSDSAPSLPVRLHRHGIATTALFATHNPRIEPAVLPGFDVQLSPTQTELRWSARELTNRALASLPAGRGLVWLHYYDAHLPYPRGPARVEAPPGRPSEMARYLTALQTVDEELGRLHDELVHSGRWQKTLFIVTSDHGEAFGEHGVPYHGLGGYQSVVHVPGLVAGGMITPLRTPALVSHRDVPATVLGAFGLVKAEPDVEDPGRSWLRLRTTPAQHQFVVIRSASGSGGSKPMAALVDGRWKLLVTLENDLLELYDLERDPEEAHDLRAERPADTARLSRQLALYRDVDGFP